MTIIGLWFMGFVWFSSQSMPELHNHNFVQKAEKADAIVVLTGSPDRIDVGLQLFTEKKAPKLFISGVNPKVQIDDITKKWNGAELPDCCIELGYQAGNTQGNAEETIEWIQKNDIQSIYLVTSDYHMMRSKLEFSFVQKELEIYAYPVISQSKESGWRKYTTILFKEYHKTILSYIRHLLFNSTS